MVNEMIYSSSSSSIADLSEKTQSLLLLFRTIIEREEWNVLDQILTVNPEVFKAVDNIVSSVAEFNGMTFLHACTRHHPPVHIVSKMISLSANSLSRGDSHNRTALHVACGVGASAEVIQCLVLANPQSCTIQDIDGRTPLHFYCDIECQLFEGDDMKSRTPPEYDAVHSLLSASIGSAIVEDLDGMTPLEYAICSNADFHVVRLLQKAAQRHMKLSNRKAVML